MTTAATLHTWPRRRAALAALLPAAAGAAAEPAPASAAFVYTGSERTYVVIGSLPVGFPR